MALVMALAVVEVLEALVLAYEPLRQRVMAKGM
jgi:hypothetical protein